VVESQLVVGGIPIQVLDTAGIRETGDKVEKIGVERSHQAAQQADLVLLTLDAQLGWTKAEQLIYEQVKNRPLILVINKTDLGDPTNVNYPNTIPQMVTTAAAQNQGIDALETAILQQVNHQKIMPKNLDFAINQRQAAVLIEAQLALANVQQTLKEELPLDFWTIDLRLAIQALGNLTGENVTESVLDRIFSRFCIGK
jgi:tRNA modification GTPase